MTNDDWMRAIAGSVFFSADWYRSRYPDVAASGLDPRTHYLRHGARLGREPGPDFDSAYYYLICPKARHSRLPALLHYELDGRHRNLHPGTQARDAARRTAREQADMLSYKLFILGLVPSAREEMEQVSTQAGRPLTRAYVAERLAWWHLWRGCEPQDWYAALEHLDRAAVAGTQGSRGARLALLRLLALIRLKETDSAHALLDELAQSHLQHVDHLMATTGIDRSFLERRPYINAAMRLAELPVFDFGPGDAAPLDRLVLQMGLPARAGGRAVSVVLAVPVGAGPELTAVSLAALAVQDWPDLEVLVAAAEDTELPELPKNAKRIAAPAGANWGTISEAGLTGATAPFVTVLRAGDYIHPRRISLQAEHLMIHREVMACTAQSAFLTPDLEARIWCGPWGVGIVHDDPEALMFRRVPVREALGARDHVPGAGTEFMARIERRFGASALSRLETGPVTFLRDAPRPNGISEAVWGRLAPETAGPFAYGAARDYLEAQRHHHEAGELLYAQGRRPFAAPPRLTGRGRQHFDVILGSDFRLIGGSTQSNAAELAAQKRAGLSTGLFQMYRYDFYARPERMMLPEIRAQIDGEAVQVIDESSEVSCDLLVLRYPSIIENLHAHLPRIQAGAVKVIVNQPPMSDYTGQGKIRYGLRRADDNAAAMFGQRPLWHPIGPLVRQALHEHHAEALTEIELASQDWFNIIDIDGWERPAHRPDPSRPPRIGRHSRDHEVKWPARAEEIRAAYPLDGSAEVHVLGGARAAEAVLGHWPESWTVHEFGAVRPQDFLKDLDFWVYFAHPDWVESFGRTIIEAMAVGVPVILPELYRPLFGETALYAIPSEVPDIVTRLWADPATYEAQVARAQAHVRETYSYKMHTDRLRRAMRGEM